jgi:hypothetical protein
MKHIFTFTFVIAVFTITCLDSCSNKERFTKSVIVPGASGEVKVKHDQNKNYEITVKVKDLTPATKLIPSKEMYVVWNESASGTTSLGHLVSSRSIIARGYKGSLNAVATDKPKRIFITAEDDPKTQVPGTQVVMTTDEF